MDYLVKMVLQKNYENKPINLSKTHIKDYLNTHLFNSFQKFQIYFKDFYLASC